MKHISCSLLILHAEDDPVVPFRLGRKVGAGWCLGGWVPHRLILWGILLVVGAPLWRRWEGQWLPGPHAGRGAGLAG